MRRSYAIDFRILFYFRQKISRVELHNENRKEQLYSVRPSMKHVTFTGVRARCLWSEGGRGRFSRYKDKLTHRPSPPLSRLPALTLVWKQQQQQHKWGSGKKRGGRGSYRPISPFPRLLFCACDCVRGTLICAAAVCHRR